MAAASTELHAAASANLEFKIVVIGSAGVGKSSLLTRLTSDTFDRRREKATIGTNVHTSRL